MELSRPKLKKLLYISERNLQNLKKKFFHIFYLLRKNFSNIGIKEKSFLYFPL